jgi:hypothetical protein
VCGDSGFVSISCGRGEFRKTGYSKGAGDVYGIDWNRDAYAHIPAGAVKRNQGADRF